MFCGVGDARHFYATLARIHDHTKSRPQLASKKYHFTLLDLKPSMLARDLIIFSMLDDISRLSKDSPAEIDTLLTLFYTWSGFIMPAHAIERLQKTIDQILVGIDRGLLPKWFRVPAHALPKIRIELQGWRDGIDATYTARRMRIMDLEQQERTRMQNRMNAMQYMGIMDDMAIPPPDGCDVEHKVYEAIGVLIYPKRLLETKEPEFAAARAAGRA